MKNIRFLTFVLTIATLVLSACGAVTATPSAAPEAAAGAKVDAMPVAFVGIIDSITGDQWVISGTTVTVDASIVRDGPFNVGDQVKVEGLVNPDGSLTVSRVEAPTPQETATLPPLIDDNSNDALTNANTNDANANINDDNSNGGNTNDDKSNDANINDDNGGGNTNNDNSNDGNTNDDNGGGNSNNDNSNNGNTNDDNGGGNSNNDNSNGSDDHGGGNSNDDHSGGGGGNGNDDSSLRP